MAQPLEATGNSFKFSGAAVLAVLIPLWYLVVAVDFDQTYPPLPYPVTEWLVTYSAGFVRRGLLGQSVLDLGLWLQAPPLAILFWLRLGLSLVFLGTVAYLLLRSQRSLGIMGVLLVLLNPAVCDYCVRNLGSVDLLFILISVVNQMFATRLEEGAYLRSAILLMGLVGVLIGLSHEGFLFLGIPLNLAISYRKLSWPKWKRLFAIYGLPILSCLLALKFAGTAAQAGLIKEIWARQGISMPVNSTLHSFGGTFYQELGFVRRLSDPLEVAVCVLAFGCAFLPVYLAYRTLRSNTGFDRSLLRDYFLFPMVCALPLYVIGVDWNRWVGIPICSGILCLLCTDLFKDGLTIRRGSWRACFAFVILGAFTIPAAPYFGLANVFHGSVPSSVEVVKQVVKRAISYKKVNG